MPEKESPSTNTEVSKTTLVVALIGCLVAVVCAAYMLSIRNVTVLPTVFGIIGFLGVANLILDLEKKHSEND